MDNEHPDAEPDPRPWLPPGFEAPARLELATGAHLRPIRGDDVDLDYAAVISSRRRLWDLFGRAWGWPTESMTKEQDRADLERHEDEMRRNVSFNYAIFDREETELLGCVYIDPPREGDADADIVWWVVEKMLGTALERELADEIPPWIREAWPFERPRIVGIDISWERWERLPHR